MKFSKNSKKNITFTEVTCYEVATSQNHEINADPHSRENQPIRGEEAAAGVASCQLMQSETKPQKLAISHQRQTLKR